jgi:hypothetical protein
MVKKIPLTQGKYALVDDENYTWLNQYNWCCSKSTNKKSKKVYYRAVRGTYNPITKKKNSIQMHREILAAREGEVINHINGNMLDNRKANLRILTRRQCYQNQTGKECTSKYPGVSWRENKQKWEASIFHKGKTIYLGQYTSEDEAYQIYKKMCNQLAEENTICELNLRGLELITTLKSNLKELTEIICLDLIPKYQLDTFYRNIKEISIESNKIANQLGSCVIDDHNISNLNDVNKKLYDMYKDDLNPPKFFYILEEILKLKREIK